MPSQFNGDDVIHHAEDDMLQDAAAVDKEVQCARLFVSALVKAIRASAYYPPGHAMAHEYLGDLSFVLHQYLDQYDLLTLTITEFQILLEGHLLYENHDLASSLSFLLYRDGVRELRFGKQVEDWELEGLINILQQANTINTQEDDIVTLLWEQEFLHLDFVAIDDLLEDVANIVPQNAEQFRARSTPVMPVLPGVEEDTHPMQAFLDESSGTAASEQIVPAEITTTDWLQTVSTLTPEESEMLQVELAGELSPDFLLSVVDGIFNFLVLEIKREPFHLALQFLLKCLDAQVTARDFRKASEILQLTNQAIQLREMADWQLEELKAMLTQAGDAPRIERIVHMLEQQETSVSMDEVKGYLAKLNYTAIVPLIHALGSVKRMTVRATLCEVLAELGKMTISLFAPFVQPNQPWFLIRNVATVLGHIGRSECIALLRTPFVHADARVRREVIQSLGCIGGTEAVRLLSKALRDEDSQNRGIAAISLGKVGTDEALNVLLAEIDAKDFQQKALTEINHFFDGLGVARSTRAIPLLQHYLERRLLLGQKKGDQLRAEAAKALAKIGSPEALAILQAGIQSHHAAISHACRHAQSTLQSSETT